MSVEWIRMEVLEDLLEGRREIGRPRFRWRDQVDGSLRKLGVTNWREKVKDRAGWRNMLSSFFYNSVMDVKGTTN